MRNGVATRTCAGCRKAAPRNDLLRFARAAGPAGIAPDLPGRAAGRGLSVHPRPSCLNRAVKRGAFQRAFGATVRPDPRALVDASAEQYRMRVERLLAVARRNRQLCSGARAVRDSLKSRTALVVVIARDASATLLRIAGSAERSGARSFVSGTREGLGRVSGRRPLGAVAVTDPLLAERISSAAERAAALEEDA